MRSPTSIPTSRCRSSAGATALAVVLVAGGQHDDAPEGAAPVIVAEGELRPRISLFGDTVTATVVATLNPRAIDPDSVRVAGSFSPFQQVGKARRIVRSAGDTTSIETTFVLRCLASACVPGTTTIQAQFEPARVAYAIRAGGPEQAIEAGGLLVLGGGVLAYRMLPRRAPPPEPEAPPEPELTALERALAVLESPAQADGVADRRRALELIADEAAQWKDNELTQTARELAWSEDVPEEEAARALVARVRAHLEEQDDGRLA